MAENAGNHKNGSGNAGNRSVCVRAAQATEARETAV